MTTLKHLAAGVAGFGMVAVLIGQAQNPPAPTVDRVGFPMNYQTTMDLLYVFDRPDTKQIRTVYANAPVFTVQRDGSQSNYPYGSVIVFEAWAALKDANGNAILDGNGRFQKDPAATPTIFVMRKEKGFGVDYGPNRNGEWEYVAYTPTGAYSTTPQNSFSCAICHIQAGQAKDWVFRANLHFNQASGAVPAGVIKNYSFTPNAMHVKAGSTITLYNDDVVAHTIVDDSAGGFASPQIKAGGSIDLKFGNVPFEWDYHCSIHPGMKGKIIVDP